MPDPILRLIPSAPGPQRALCSRMLPIGPILTAVAPDTMDRVRRILIGHDLRIVHDLASARAVMSREDIGLIFVGVRFDESRMFDLIELVRTGGAKRKIPIVAAIIAPTHLALDAIVGLGHSVKVFGASVFVNLNDFPDDDIGNARVRLIVDTVVMPAETVAQIAPDPLKPPAK